MIKFKYEGPTRVGFAAIGRELGEGEEFDVPEHLALSFAGHGHCTCLEPEKLAPLRAAEEAQQQAQDAAREAAGLVNMHPLAQAAAAAKTAAATPEATAPPAVPDTDQAPPAVPDTDQAPPAVPDPAPAAPAAASAASAVKRAKSDPAAAAAK